MYKIIAETICSEKLGYSVHYEWPRGNPFLVFSSEANVAFKRLGNGAFGAVFKLEDSNGTRAIKLASSRKNMSAICYEQKLLMDVGEHENIVRYQGGFVHKDNLVGLQFSLYAGDVFHLLEIEKRLNLNQLRGFSSQLLAALFYIHKIGVTHRDLKPSNIMYQYRQDAQVRFYLGDLGGAFSQRISDEYSFSVGTCAYRSPEVVYEFNKQHPAIDMWSFGATLMRLYTNKHCFPAKNNSEVKFNYFDRIAPILVQEKINKLHPKIGQDFFWMSNVYRGSLPDIMSFIRMNVPEKMRSQLFENLIFNFLDLDFSTRISAKKALEHPFITE